MSRDLGRLLRTVAAVALLCAAQTYVAGNALALNCSPYSTFLSLPASALGTLEVKVSYVGVSNAAFPSFGVTAIGNTFQVSQFSPCQQLPGAYFNDSTMNVAFASTQELHTLIANVGGLAAVTAGGVTASPFLSFSLSVSQPSNIAFEAIVDQPTASALLAQIATSLASEATASQMLSQLGCDVGITSSTKPSDVTTAFTVKLSGVRLRRSDGLFVADLQVTNNSAGSPPAPVSVVLGLAGNVRLANPDGHTCAVAPGGKAFINLATIPAQGSSVTLPVQFTNPDVETITITPQVLAGPGSR
jgi:hypothetical protein